MATQTGDSRVATASYMEGMLAELRTMGQKIECDFLVYLIEMAMIEASDVASGKNGPARASTPVQEKSNKRSAEQLAELFLAGQLD